MHARDMPFNCFQRPASLRDKPFGNFLALNMAKVERWNMKAQPDSNDPARMLAHASIYVWKYWRQYALTAWEDAESILRKAYDAVEEEDRVEFIRALDSSVRP